MIILASDSAGATSRASSWHQMFMTKLDMGARPRVWDEVNIEKSKAWRISRSITLFVVLALHFAVLALLVVGFRNQHYGMPAAQAIELVYLPAVKVAQVRADALNRPRLKTDITMAKTEIPTPLAPPVDSSSSRPGSSSAPAGGSAVNWAAEAHRAINAFEIRRDQPQDPAQSVSSTWNEWWPRQHHAGDQFKTESGDWIVWISADCYQIAVAHSNPAALSTSTPQTVCPRKRAAPRTE